MPPKRKKSGYLLRDLEAGLLEVHDGVGDLDVDGLDHGLDVEGTHQPLTHGDQTVWKFEFYEVFQT